MDWKKYSAERSILRKRLERLTAKYPDNVRAAQILEQVRKNSVAEMRKAGIANAEIAMMQIEGWLGQKSLSLAGMKASKLKAVKTLQARGWNITESNIAKFGEVMEYLRARAGQSSGSPDVEAMDYIVDNLDNASVEELGEEVWQMFD